jgi:hypothetical protein
VKARHLRTGMWVKHGDEFKYLKTMSFTMGNIIHVTLRSEGGSVEQDQFTLEQDVEVRM